MILWYRYYINYHIREAKILRIINYPCTCIYILGGTSYIQQYFCMLQVHELFRLISNLKPSTYTYWKKVKILKYREFLNKYICLSTIPGKNKLITRNTSPHQSVLDTVGFKNDIFDGKLYAVKSCNAFFVSS